MPTPGSSLTPRTIFAFWAPLAATWLMMSFEGPFLAAVAARLADPEPNLAAFGVALSLALILESPVIMLMAAGTALVRDRGSFVATARFSYGLSALMTGIMLVVLVPSVYGFLAGEVLTLPPDVAPLTYHALWLLLPWPGFIGVRRFYQGVLICRGRTRRVGYGTAVRLAVMAAAALALYHRRAGGATTAAVALSAGVVVEALACRWMARPAVAELRATRPETAPPTQREIARFYAPLALSVALTLAIHPTATFFLARAREPVASLAVFPVVRALVFVFSCLGLSYQEAAIALLGDHGEGFRPLRRFAVGLAAAVTGLLALVALTPLGDLWYLDVSGLSPGLAALARWPTGVLVVVPALTVILSFLRARFVHGRRTRPITVATVAEVIVIGMVLWLGIAVFDGVGVTVAAVALVAGRTVSAAALWWPARGLETG